MQVAQAQSTIHLMQETRGGCKLLWLLASLATPHFDIWNRALANLVECPSPISPLRSSIGRMGVVENHTTVKSLGRGVGGARFPLEFDIAGSYHVYSWSSAFSVGMGASSLPIWRNLVNGKRARKTRAFDRSDMLPFGRAEVAWRTGFPSSGTLQDGPGDCLSNILSDHSFVNILSQAAWMRLCLNRCVNRWHCCMFGL